VQLRASRTVVVGIVEPRTNSNYVRMFVSIRMVRMLLE
jgi:hypothetical protein